MKSEVESLPILEIIRKVRSMQAGKGTNWNFLSTALFLLNLEWTHSIQYEFSTYSHRPFMIQLF